jgi:hypothetical protein
MALPLKPEVILTHESDLDGFVSGLLLQRLARKLYNVEPRLESFHYDGWRMRPMHERTAWVADLAFEARLDKPGWLIIDHHWTETVPKQATLIHDVTKSASLLVYELCCQHGLQSAELDRLVRLSNVADMFAAEDADFFLAMDYAGLVKTYQFWNLHALTGGQLERLLDHPLLEVLAVKRRVEDPLGLEYSKAHVTQITPAIGLVPAVVGNSNLILHQLLQDSSTSYEVLITMLRKGAGNISLSMRSRHGEAYKVAVQLQGGGHPNAAGATLPRSVQNLTDAVDYLRKVLNPRAAWTAPADNLESLFDSAKTRELKS